jgi:hypothetical protein
MAPMTEIGAARDARALRRTDKSSRRGAIFATLRVRHGAVTGGAICSNDRRSLVRMPNE